MPLPPPSPDSVALVTGASSGIGEHFARKLASRGYRVAIVARRTDRLEALAPELGADAITITADLAEPADRDRLEHELETAGVDVDVLVNNAGFGIYQAFGDEGRDKELQQVRVDVEAVVDLTARFLPGMKERRRGSIINLASSAGFQPTPFSAGYGAAKAYVLSLSEAMNEELKGTGVSVTAVCPGPVPTEFGEVNDVGFLKRMPKFSWVSVERVVDDAIAAAEADRRSIVPGNALVKAGFVPNRRIPSALTLPITAKLMSRKKV
jgi:short-subunit dehydrogenase